MDKKPYIKRLGALEKRQQDFISFWSDISSYVTPYRGKFNDDKTASGARKGEKILRDRAGLALRTFSSGLMAGITSPSYPWFYLQPTDTAMNQFKPVKEWLFLVQELMREVFNSSNLYRCLPTLYKELGAYGTACMSITQSFKNVIRCHVPTIGTYLIANNDEYAVDVVYRKFQMTVAQLMEKHEREGWEVSDKIKNAFEKGNTEELHEIIHCCEPNDKRIVDKNDIGNKAYRSLYFDKSTKDEFLHSGGFDDFPYAVIRWETVGEDEYGLECPGMNALGDIRQLQSQIKRKAQGLDKIVDPPLIGPAGLVGKKINAIPGGFTAEEPGLPAQLRPLYEVRMPFGEIMNDISQTEDIIARAFYEDMFLMLAQTDRRQITAREVAERHEEKLIMLGPALVRLHDELLRPLIERTFGIMLSGGLLPPAPPELAGQELKVEFVSLLAQAQKSVGVLSVDNMVNTISGLAQLDPKALNKLNINEVIDTKAESLGVNPNIIRTNDEANAISEAQQEAMAQQQQMAQIQEMAKTGAEVSNSNLPEMLNRAMGSLNQ